jgi:integrase
LNQRDYCRRKAIHSLSQSAIFLSDARFSCAKPWRGRITMQRGSLAMVSRKEGPAVWQFRCSEKSWDGARVQRKRVIGTIERYPNEAAARSAVTVLLAEINSEKSRIRTRAITVAQLCDHFEQRELAKDNTWRSHATKKTYLAYLNRWVRPHWRQYELAEVRTIQVESWLRRLPLAKSSCAKIRNLMSVLFNHACRYELFDRNPIHLVRQSAKRRRTPIVLVPAEIKALVDNLSIRERTLVLLAVSTDLRQSELFGLRWGDIDFSQGTMNVTRSIVYGVVGPCKTESSQKPVPVHPLVANALLAWRKQSTYTKPDDWIFASRRHRGRHQFWGQAILRKHVRPIAEKVGIQKCIGWHTFRHTYSTLLRSVGTEFKVMQELLRHSTLRSTLDVYTQAITPAKHAAQAAVLSLVFSHEAGGTSQLSSSNAAG